MSIKPRALAIAATLLAVTTFVLHADGARAAGAVSPSSPSATFDTGPFTGVYPADPPCAAPSSCSAHPFTVAVPSGYYQALRDAGRAGAVQVTVSWATAQDDLDLALLDGNGAVLAASSQRNTAFERLVYTEPEPGNYDVRLAVVRANGAAPRVEIRLVELSGAAAAPVSSGDPLLFSGGAPVSLERTTGEPGVHIAPNGTAYVDTPAAGSSSLLHKSPDGGRSFIPLAKGHPNHNPLDIPSGGLASAAAIAPDGRLCFSDLSPAGTVAVTCTANEGVIFAAPHPLASEPGVPVVGRQWQAATADGAQFVAAQVGSVGIRLWKETPTGSAQAVAFTPVQTIDPGAAVHAFNLAASGTTLVGAYLKASGEPATPYDLMIWRTTDGGISVSTHRVARLSSDPGNKFASVALDTQGNAYAAWVEQGTWDVLYAKAGAGDLDNWSGPVRVSSSPEAATALAPTIRAGDPGRVVIAYYGAAQQGHPDALTDASWHGFVASSLDGVSFRQDRVTQHAVQYGGICLDAASCPVDPYDGDRTVGRRLGLDIVPATGQALVVVTDSSRTDRGTTVTAFRQISGPSAFASRGAVVDDPGRGTSTADEQGDAIAIQRCCQTLNLDALDFEKVSLTRLDGQTLRATMTMMDINLFSRGNQQGGVQVVIGMRFATDLDVFWVGFRYNAGGAREFFAGRLARGALVDAYTPDPAIVVTGVVEAASRTITIDIPREKFETTLLQPASAATPAVVPGLADGQAVYDVVGMSFIARTASEDPMPKHWVDVTPAFTPGGTPVTPQEAAAQAGRGSLGVASADASSLPATGGTSRWPLVLGLMSAGLIARIADSTTRS